jgi:4-hydroxybenzoate polyprenyltransferase
MIRKIGPGWMKEFSIAVFYVIGIVWLPLLRADAVDITWPTLLYVPGYTLLAFLNLLMLSFLDREEDRKSGFFSVASTLPTQKIIQLIRQLAFALIFLSLAGFILLPSFFRPFSCLVLLMALVHYLTFFQRGLTAPQKRQRMEWAFSIPWLLLIL